MAGSLVVGLGGLGHLVAQICSGDPDPQLMAALKNRAAETGGEGEGNS